MFATTTVVLKTRLASKVIKSNSYMLTVSTKGQSQSRSNFTDGVIVQAFGLQKVKKKKDKCCFIETRLIVARACYFRQTNKSILKMKFYPYF